METVTLQGIGGVSECIRGNIMETVTLQGIGG